MVSGSVSKLAHYALRTGMIEESGYIVYYNEHCISLNRERVPMKIGRACFAKLLDGIL